LTGDVYKLTLQVRAPRGRDPGKVQIGYWCIADRCVVLCDENGRPIDGEKRPINPGGDPKLIAVAMMKARRRSSASGSGGFNRPLHYQKIRY
jgi:hypothetical protein